MRGGVNRDTMKLISDNNEVGIQQEDCMVKLAIENAKFHGIGLHLGVRNLANGNCAFESIIERINTRPEFQEFLDRTPDDYRYIWMTVVENVAFENWNQGLNEDQCSGIKTSIF